MNRPRHAIADSWDDLASRANACPTFRRWPRIVHTIWKTITVADWYGKGKRSVEVVSRTAVWYSTWLARRAPALGLDPRP